MPTLSPRESHIWEKPAADDQPPATDEQINERYLRGEGRIVIETNREKLPGFVTAMKVPGYMDLRPFYQRRPRWNQIRQSLLIESFIMNVPVPPVFLFEKDLNKYEVMDGQQRLTALRAFFSDELELAGLQMWPELNGRTYDTLPDKIKAGIDRRSITSIVVLKESSANEEDASFLRETVFERLNTGGVALSKQEIRNALYPGLFNDLLLELSRLDIFREAWHIPKYVDNEIELNPSILEHPVYKTMGDMEIVLRFFALRHVAHFKRGVQGFLDIYMRKAMSFLPEDIDILRTIFAETLELCVQLYGDFAFHPFDRDKGEWEAQPHRAFYDAVMIGLSERRAQRDELIKRKNDIIKATRELFVDLPSGTFTGRANTKKDTEQRLQHYADMLTRVLA